MQLMEFFGIDRDEHGITYVDLNHQDNQPSLYREQSLYEFRHLNLIWLLRIFKHTSSGMSKQKRH